MKNNNIIMYIVSRLFFITLLSTSQVLFSAVNIVPSAVSDSIYKYKEDNPCVFKNIDLNDAFIKHKMFYAWVDLPYGYKSYDFAFLPSKRISLLYDSNSNKSYILNEGYSTDKISIVLMKLGAFPMCINSQTIDEFTSIIFDCYSINWGYVGNYSNYEEYIISDELEPLIIPNEITFEDLKKISFPPELIIIQKDRLYWKLRFIVYLFDGSIEEWIASGSFSNTCHFEFKNVIRTQISPINSVKLIDGSVRFKKKINKIDN